MSCDTLAHSRQRFLLRHTLLQSYLVEPCLESAVRSLNGTSCSSVQLILLPDIAAEGDCSVVKKLWVVNVQLFSSCGRGSGVE
jgi:hypothetical protein